MTPRRPLWRRVLLPAFLALVALNLGVLAAWTAPRTLRLRNATQRVEAAREAAAAARQEAARLAERAEAIRQNSVDLKRFYEDVIGPEKTDLLPTLRDIERMARGPGLRPGARRYQREAVEDAAVQRVAVSVPLEGSYSQLVGFLREVERSERFLTVDRITLTGEEAGEADLQVELSAYMALPPGSAVRRRRGGAR